jgi:hypothetical protein
VRAAVAIVACGCVIGEVPSSETATRDLDVLVKAEDEGRGLLTVSVQFDGPDGLMLLTGDDARAFRVSIGGQRLQLEIVQSGDDEWYVARGVEADGLLVVDVDRRGDRPIHGEIEVPPPFSLEAEPIVGDAPLALRWTADPDGEHELTLSVEGDCVLYLRRALARDLGEYDLSTAELAPYGAGGLCPLEVGLERTTFVSGPGTDSRTFQASTLRARTITVPWSPQ